MRTAFALVTVMTSSALAQPPTITVNVASSPSAWSVTTAQVVIRTGSQPIVPLAVELATPAGTIAGWGMEATGASIQARWAYRAPARKLGDKWELLLGQYYGQRVEPPTPIMQQARDTLIRVEPLAAGTTAELSARLVATYDNAGPITVTMRYLVIDAAAKPCAPRTSEFTQPTLVGCEPASPTAGGPLYITETTLTRAAQVRGSTTLTVAHPAFDLAAARTRAGVASGRHGYIVDRQQWVIVDDAKRRTIVVGATATSELPGDWTEILVGFGHAPTTEQTVYWTTRSEADARAIIKDATAGGLSAQLHHFKGGRPDSTRVVLTFRRANIDQVAALITKRGYLLIGSDIRDLANGSRS